MSFFSVEAYFCIIVFVSGENSPCVADFEETVRRVRSSYRVQYMRGRSLRSTNHVKMSTTSIYIPSHEDHPNKRQDSTLLG